MDTISHAIIGMAVASLSGQTFSIDNPIYLAALLGAQAPDFDIIALVRGDFAFLRQHRALSHSIPGIIVWSTLIAVALYLYMPSSTLLALFGWALTGSLSHVIIDYFNTHGAAILWPLRKERKSLHLLNVYDPYLLALMLSLYLFNLQPIILSFATFFSLAAYILWRFYLRFKAKQRLMDYFATQDLSRMVIMPSLKRVFTWDFVAETSGYYYVGRIGAIKQVVDLHAELPKQTKLSEITEKVQGTILGNFFNTFTPFAYYEEEYNDSFSRINIYDLRYFLNQQFIHRATIIFNEANYPSATYLHSEGKTIKVPC
jgi:Predicted membrane-bound metal-dependent hydrolases